MSVYGVEGGILSNSQTGNSVSGPLESIKSILFGDGGNRQEDIKTLAIFIAFQVLVPGAIKLISYAANSVDVYLGHNESGDLEQGALSPEMSIDPGGGAEGGITNDPVLVESIQQDLSGMG
jgi:hypothetical protein